MKSFTQDEYLRLIEECAEQEYGDETDNPEYEYTWMSDKASYIKSKIKNPTSGTIDLSKIKKESIKDTLFKSTVFKIGTFTIKVTKYHSYPIKNNTNQDLKIDLAFLHDVTKTPSGAPCKMQYKFDIGKDSRFTNRPWLIYLTDNSSMKNVPIEEAVEVIRWFQGLIRMTAFL